MQALRATNPNPTPPTAEASIQTVLQRFSAHLGEQGVEAVHFLFLLHECVVLGDALQGQLVHQVDDVGLAQPPLLELLHGDWESGRVEHDLAVVRQEVDELFNQRLKLRRQQLVSLRWKSGKAPQQQGFAHAQRSLC